jgi:hypothetical protein
VFRNANGTWSKVAVPIAPNATGRTRIVLDHADNIMLSVLYQQGSTGTTPSPIRVADLRLGG